LNAARSDAARRLTTLSTTVARSTPASPRYLRDWPEILMSRATLLAKRDLQRVEPSGKPLLLVGRQVVEAFNVGLDQRLQVV